MPRCAASRRTGPSPWHRGRSTSTDRFACSAGPAGPTAALRTFFIDTVVPLAHEADVTLCLRFDADKDGTLEAAQKALDALAAELLPSSHQVELLLLSEPMPYNTPQRLGLNIHAWIGDSPSTTFVNAVGAPVFETPHPVLATWAQLRAQLQAWDAPTTQ